MARECLELVLEVHAETHRDQVLPGMDASHVVVGTIDAEVPDVLLNDVREYEAEMERRKPEVERMKMERRKEREREAIAEDGELSRGTLRNIQKQAGLSGEEFDRVANEVL